ncbi:MAG: DNA polymerase III subunit gamma/tau [Gemmataceae bacterium]|nr:DNA polymerase III subunit gamma/tau [Gemmataceae bacterium]
MAKRKPATDATAAAPQESYTVLARRYRPRQFAELIGQEAPARALINALESNRVAHAYLFTGARGVGKTSTARILAKALNCVKGPTATPCDQCDICQSIASGEDVDVLEIDGASNRGIDEVREIRQNVQYRPGRGRYKIYIIDEVHMLTPAAFNALLKTLEEPPAHVKFIFATTEVQKIPVTILSRCQRFDFAGIGTPRIVERLRGVVTSEGMQADDDALELVARRAGGSMRDAQSLLDQLLAFGGERLTSEQVHQLLGTAHDDRVAELAAAVLAKDTKQALELLAMAAAAGAQLGELLDQLIDYWRDLMVVRCAGKEARDLSVPSRLREALNQQAEGLSLDTILAGLEILSAAKARLRASNHGRTLVEMALVRLGRLDDLVSLSQLIEMASGERKAAPSSRSEARPAAPVVRSATQVTRPAPPVAAPEPTLSKQLTEESLARVWSDVLSQIPPMMRSELEKAGFPAISGPNTLVLRFALEYNHQREHCSDPKRMERVESTLRTITGHAWTLRIESAGGDGADRQPAPVEESDSSQSRSRRQRDEALKEPLVQRAIDVLGAQIVRVDEGFSAARAPATERNDDSEAEEG